jgi:hypothetical protein
MWLEEEKWAKLLTTLHSWIRAGSLGQGVPSQEFKSVVAKLRHAFTALPGGRGLLSPCDRLLKRRLQVIYFHWNELLLSAISNCWTILRESTSCPTRCRKLVAGWPDFVGVVDASSHGVGGVIFKELSECPPTVFHLQQPPDITTNVVSEANPGHHLPGLILNFFGKKITTSVLFLPPTTKTPHALIHSIYLAMR